MLELSHALYLWICYFFTNNALPSLFHEDKRAPRDQNLFALYSASHGKGVVETAKGIKNLQGIRCRYMFDPNISSLAESMNTHRNSLNAQFGGHMQLLLE
jgi:hypothetical protein